MATVRILLVDDHVVLRLALKNLLEMEGHAQVVAEASSACEALERVSEVRCDVVVMDVSLPDKDGLSCVKDLRERHPDIRVLMFSVHADDEIILDALRCGANGYLVKTATYGQFIEALREIHAGGTYVQPRIAARVAVSCPAASGAAVGPDPPTNREVEALSAVASGLSNKEIAHLMGISEITVKSHLRSLYQKLGATNRVQAILRAASAGILRGPAPGPEGLGAGLTRIPAHHA